MRIAGCGPQKGDPPDRVSANGAKFVQRNIPPMLVKLGDRLLESRDEPLAKKKTYPTTGRGGGAVVLKAWAVR